jgi:hypothetical protein
MLILLVYRSSEQNLLFKSEVDFPNIGINAIANQNLKISSALPWLAC